MPGVWHAGQLADGGARLEEPPGTPGPAIFYHAAGEADLDRGALFDADDEDEQELSEECPGAGRGDGPRLLSAGSSGLPRASSNLMRLLGLWRQPEPLPDEADECRRRALHLGEAGGGECDDLPPTAPAATPRLTCLDGPVLHTAEPDVVGTFEKKSPWWVEGWRTRAYRLRDRKLLYFKRDRPDRPQGVLDFGLVRYELHCCWQHPGEGKVDKQDEPEKPRRCDVCDVPMPGSLKLFYLRPVAFPSKVFAFRGFADEMETLTKRIANLVAMPLLSTLPHERNVVSLKNFWRYPFIREHEFQKQVESGDLLLFRGRDAPAKLQRAATGAEYDHVALLIKSANDEVFVLEATGNHGVKILSWEYFTGRRWHQCYAWIAYRKVYFQRTPEQLHALQTFITAVLGLPYGLSLGKLVARTLSEAFDEQGEPVAPSPAAAGKGHRNLFCSELAAACLKRCGVLAGARASSRYWPSSFSQHCAEPLPLQEHAHVGEEQVIVFGA